MAILPRGRYRGGRAGGRLSWTISLSGLCPASQGSGHSLAWLPFVAEGSRHHACRPDQRRLKGPIAPRKLSTTTRHYVKDVPENTRLAMNLLEELFNKCSTAVPWTGELTY